VLVDHLRSTTRGAGGEGADGAERAARGASGAGRRDVPRLPATGPADGTARGDRRPLPGEGQETPRHRPGGNGRRARRDHAARAWTRTGVRRGPAPKGTWSVLCRSRGPARQRLCRRAADGARAQGARPRGTYVRAPGVDHAGAPQRAGRGLASVSDVGNGADPAGWRPPPEPARRRRPRPPRRVQPRPAGSRGASPSRRVPAHAPTRPAGYGPSAIRFVARARRSAP